MPTVVSNSETEISNILKVRYDLLGNGQFTTDWQGHLWMSDGDPRTRTFHQMRVTAGDTTCSVTGILGGKLLIDELGCQSLYLYTDLSFSLLLDSIEREEAVCGMPCPGDCVMSLWSEYGPCFTDCRDSRNRGQEVRSRSV